MSEDAMTTPKYNPDFLRAWANWYDDKTDSDPPYQFGDDPGHSELLRAHANAIELLGAKYVEIDGLEQDLSAIHDLFRKATGYTAQEYILMREEIRDAVSGKP